MTEETTIDKEDLRLLYTVTVNDIQNFKSQQWKVTNYVLLLFTAFISITKLLDEIYCFERVILCLATIVITIIGCFLTRQLHKSIDLRQGRLQRIRKKIGSKFRKCWKGGKSADEITASKGDLLWLFLSIQISAGVIVLWLLIRSLLVT